MNKSYEELAAENEILREELTYATIRIDGEWGSGNWDQNLDTEYDIPQRVAAKLKPAPVRPTPGLGGLLPKQSGGGLL